MAPSSSSKRRRAAAAAGKGGDAGTSAPVAPAAAASAKTSTAAAAAAAAAVAHDASKLPSLSEIKGALPKECFSASTELSLYYALRDAVMMAVLLASGRWLWTSGGGAAVFFCGAAASEAAGGGGGGVCGQLAAGVVWPLYWLVLGTVMWGVFVVGHDCGHGSFSRYRWLNTVVGSVMHSSILTPYMPWRRTHRQHHKHTGNMDRDEIFQPIRRRRAASPFWRYSRNFGPALFGLGAAWFMYLIFGFAPRNLLGYHFWPLTLPSTERVRLANSAAARELIVSHGCYLAMLFGLWQWARVDGWTAVAVLYGAPLFVFATWLVVVTFLHHNQRLTIPWASNRTWTYVSGQLSTVDRSYGAFLDNITHHIGTHQIHHLFPAIPHYRLQTATRAFRKAYPHLVRTSDEPIPVAFVRNARHYDKNAVVDDTVDTVIM